MLNDHTPARPNQQGAVELPQPDAAARNHSELVTELIVSEIESRGGAITFARYMELALYAPGLGYYSAGSRKLGESGDYTTAPELSPLFSRTVAAQVEEVLRQLEGGTLIEFGAGSGQMAAEIMLELKRRNALPERYLIFELSADLKERQQQTLSERVPELLSRVEWLNTIPPQPMPAVVIANELLDAMPVHLFSVADSRPQELLVEWRSDRFQLTPSPELGPTLAANLEAICANYRLTDGYCSEVNLAASHWLESIAAMVERGSILLIDYGYPGAQYYHPQRHTGTLHCHYRHRAHDDPFLYPGLQDITTHVDFTAIADRALSLGLAVNGFTNQANFLIANGLLEMAAEDESTSSTEQKLRIAAQIKRLTMPGEMGETFKVMALTRGISGQLGGFALRDYRNRL